MEVGLLLLWRKVLHEMGTWCCTSTSRDEKTVTARVEHEGLSFLTITLSDFCKDFERSLDEGQFSLNRATGFRMHGGLPRFLGGFLDLVFDRRTGRLLDSPSIDAIFAIRQLTLMFSKLALRASERRRKSAMAGYVQCEQEVKDADRRRTRVELREFRVISDLLWGDVLNQVNNHVDTGQVIPKHGPGATADKLYGNVKYHQLTWPDRLEKCFPALENAIPSARYFSYLDRFTFLEPGAEIPVKVISVPKTLKTPRIIAIEPTAMQYMQQGIMERLVEAIEQHDICSRLVGFEDQETNRRLARQASRDGSLATLDLSEASDRVSNQLVREMLHNYPSLLEAVDACRSRKADVPGYGALRLAKFASMGSALTFPIEAMVFTTLTFMGIIRECNLPLTRKTVQGLVGRVRIYGDDILTPVDTVHSVVNVLEDFGLRVNVGKSFWKGKFRESCGGDYYDGHDVSVYRVREVLPSRRTHVRQIISTVSLRNQLYGGGLWLTARWLDGQLESILGHYPVVDPRSAVLGRHSFLGFETQKMCSKLHSPLVRGYTPRSKLPTSKVDDIDALLKWFLKRGDLPFADRDHLERAGRPKSVSMRLGWLQPF